MSHDPTRSLRLLCWNLNHRARRHALPNWLPRYVIARGPDVCVFTEYVVGPDHECFLEQLTASGLGQASWSDPREGGHNQVLIVTRERHTVVPVEVPEIHPAVPTNVYQVVLQGRGLHVLGFRMPAFEGPGGSQQRASTFSWIRSVAATLLPSPSILCGDFNTGPEEPQIEVLVSDGWVRAPAGPGFIARNGAEWEIDHVFLSQRLTLLRARASWGFQRRIRVPEPVQAAGPGTPDHAALLVDFVHRARGADE